MALANGFVGDGRSTWPHQIDALSRDFTVVAWDAPGAGRSADPPEGFRAADLADCWLSLLRTLGISRAHLVGLSFGGTASLSLAGRRRYYVAPLALLGAYAGWRGSLPGDEAERRLQQCLHVAELPRREFVGTMLPGIDVPTLLRYGDKDSRVSLRVARDLEARFPAARLSILPGVGHVGSIKAPDSVTSVLGEFLRAAQVGDLGRRR